MTLNIPTTNQFYWNLITPLIGGGYEILVSSDLGVTYTSYGVSGPNASGQTIYGLPRGNLRACLRAYYTANGPASRSTCIDFTH